MSKSLATNLVALAMIAGGFYSPVYALQIKTMGFFAFSGAITNWLAIYMLFEKIPGLYGSGVIPSRFTEFKTGIKDLIMEANLSLLNNFISTLSSEDYGIFVSELKRRLPGDDEMYEM